LLLNEISPFLALLDDFHLFKDFLESKRLHEMLKRVELFPNKKAGPQIHVVPAIFFLLFINP